MKRQSIYTAAVIGCGSIGMLAELDTKRVAPASHAGSFFGNTRTRLIGLADADPKKQTHAKRLFPAVPFFSSPEEMLKSLRPDIVSIATHPDSHRKLVELAIRHGARAIICEKPLAPDSSEAKRIKAVGEKARVPIFVNYIRRFSPYIAKAKYEIERGRLGRVLQATIYYTKGAMNNGTHLIDSIRFLLGEITWVYALKNPLVSHPTGDLSVDALLGTRSGARVALQSLEARAYEMADVHLYGTEGSLSITRGGFELVWQKRAPSRDWRGYHELRFVAAEGKPISYLKSMVSHVVECLDGKASPRCSAEDGLQALMVVETLLRSAKSGKKISIPA